MTGNAVIESVAAGQRPPTTIGSPWPTRVVPLSDSRQRLAGAPTGHGSLASFVTLPDRWPARRGPPVAGFVPDLRSRMNVDVMDGSVYRRCGCRDRATGRQLAGPCPRLADAAHGQWYFAVQMPTTTGRRARVRRDGYASLAEAERPRQALLALPDAAAAGRAWTMRRFLEHWLSAVQHQLRPTTLRGYRDHVHNYLIPLLGRIRLASLRTAQVQAAFRIIGSGRTRSGRLVAPSTLDRIRATLRSALSEAVRHGLIDFNPATRVRLPKPSRVRPVVWTTTRETAWRETGVRPAVAVWTRQHLLGPPKSASSRRTIALDKITIRLLRGLWRTHRHNLTATGRNRDGYVFVDARGSRLRPDYLTRRLGALITECGLPPIRLHDLRHGAASLALAAGVNMKVVQEMLGHSSIITTADIYTSVLSEAAYAAAEASATFVLDAARNRLSLGPASQA